MMPPVYRLTIAEVCKASATHEFESWNLAKHLDWYYHCKSRSPAFFHRRWGNHKAAVSRNKREGKYLRNGPGVTFQFVKGWGMATYEDYSRTREGSLKS